MNKASKQRDCPATGQVISISECVAKRHNPYACPATCPHDPFAPANYSRFLEMEDKLNRKTMDYLLAHGPDRAAMDKAFQQISHHPNVHAMHAWFSWNLFFAAGPDGLSCAERWEKAGLHEFKSDQQFLFRAKLKTRIALLEIHRVLDDERVEAVDLFEADGRTMVFQDRSLASMALRFSCALTWVYPLPHFWRLTGTAVLIPDVAQLSADEIVAEIVQHLGGPAEVVAMRRWLAENLVRFDDALLATSRLRRMQMFAGMDARFGKAVYELKSPFASCRKQLDELPDVETDDLSDADRKEGFAEARVWFAGASPAKQLGASAPRPVLGRVLLGQAHWRVEAIGGERFAQLRQQFERCLGASVKFTGEMVNDLGAGMAAKEPAVNEAIVPPRLLKDPQQISLSSSRIAVPPAGQSRADTELALLRGADLAFLDSRIPALDNKTPREAARDPAIRPQLIRLLKQRVRQQDERNLNAGRTDDVNWLLSELGATEIIFDPPPWRPPPRDPRGETQHDPSEEEDVYLPPVADPHLPPAPPLPAKPLSYDEASNRLNAVMAVFETAEEAEDTINASGLTLIDDASEMTVKVLSDEEFAYVVPFLLQAILMLVPPGHRAPPVSYANLEKTFTSNLRELAAATSSSSIKTLSKFPEQCAQPNVMILITTLCLDSVSKAPQTLRPAPETQGVMLALIRAVVDELHDALRRRNVGF